MDSERAPLPPNNLPIQLTSFIGRQDEVAQLARLLVQTRLLTLTGAGGVGKTRLALQASDALLPCFPDGVWIVDLAPLTDDSLIASVATSAIGLGEDPSRPPLQRLSEHLSDLVILLVLDNCEHLVSGCAAMAEHLLRTCPTLRILTTSRETLNIPGEVAWPVPPLSLPDPGTTLAAEDALQFEAVRLFTERAQAVWAGFSLGDENAPAVVRIGQRLDGIPLAIELAAARVKVLNPTEIDQRLDDRFNLLTAGSRTEQPRHQTLRALVDWSHELLSESEQLLFRRLSVFAGGWTLEAAEAVCTGEGIERGQLLTLLAALVDKSLVFVAGGSGETRYGLLETLRQYAAEKLRESGEAAPMRRRHLAWFCKLAERIQPDLQGPEQALLFSRLEGELGNVRSALEWSRAEPAALEEGLRLSGALMRFWYYRGHSTEGEGWLSSLLALTPESGDGLSGSPSSKSARAAALMAAGFLAGLQRRSGDSRPLAEEALALWRELADAGGIAFSLWELGQAARLDGELERAEASLEESLSLARQLRSPSLMSAALRELGGTAYASRDYERAQALYEESLSLAQEGGDLRRIVLALNSLAALALQQGSLPAARSRLCESLAISRTAGLRVGFAPALELLACLAAMESRPERAMRLAGASASVIGALGATEFQYVESCAQAAPWLESARKALGEAVAAAAWAEGEAMSLEQAVASALLEDEAPAGLPAPDPAGGPLTVREREIVALVARGLTNREIAAELVISEGTAKRHVENILGKLGLSSRREIRAWASEHASLIDDLTQNVVSLRQHRPAGSADLDGGSRASGGT